MAYRGQAGGEAAVIDDDLGAGIVQQIGQFFIGISDVDVEGRQPGLEGAEHGLQVFIAIMQIDGQPVLAGLPIGQFAAFPVTAQAPFMQHVGQTVAALGEIVIAQAAAAEDHGLPCADPLRHQVQNVRQIEHGVLS